ncbi:MAG: VOC family protein [Rhodobacteraceae bacterium]|nr:VOC family protein [Paracoccaceae bacterium]
MTTRLDHLAIAAETLDAGVAAVEAALGMALHPGGRHARMGTHNRLLSLGPAEYLEVIAIDPDAPAPDHPRWFDLDRFTGRPRPQTWIARCDDLQAALALAPEGAGRPLDFARDDLRWRMAVPADGRLPFDSLFPALIAWQGARHAAARLPDTGARLEALVLRHPQADALRAALGPLMNDARVSVSTGPVALSAAIRTPHGLRVLE